MSLIRKHWFLSALAVSLLSGFFFSSTFQPLAESRWVKWMIVCVTMFLMALPLAIGDLRRTLTRPLGPVLASVINLGFIPLLAWPLSKFLGVEFGPGLIVVAATPATLASAAVWTRRAGGNDGVAIMVTIITNMVCFIVTPFWVWSLTGNTVDRQVFYGTAINLLIVVVMPILVAQVFRLNLRLADWSTANKPRLSFLAQVGILCMVFLGSVKSGQRVMQSDEEVFRLVPVVLMLLTVTLIHVVALVVGFGLARFLKLTRKDQIAVAISGSQKTLMVGLSVALSFGYSILPLIAYHTIQLICDTFVVEHFRRSEIVSHESHE